MKRLLILLVLLALSACMPAPLELVPPETLAAQTMAALPKTDTPTPSSTPKPSPTATLPQGPATPVLDLSIPGAYCLPTNTVRVQALVTKVLDGASIEVLMGNQTYRVRYIGLDAPGVQVPLEWQAPQSLGFNQSLVEGKNVTLISDVSDTDSDGYSLRYVIVGNSFANYEILRLGFARMTSMPPNVACDNSLTAAQVEAQTVVRGIWISSPAPTFTITLTPTITNTPRPATATRIPVCDCLGPRLTCNNFRTQSQAQQCFEYCWKQGYGDIFNLDKNSNGKACDGLSDLNW